VGKVDRVGIAGMDMMSTTDDDDADDADHDADADADG
jgi:hypothetical protein